MREGVGCREHRAALPDCVQIKQGGGVHCSGALSEDDCLIVITGPWYSSELQPWFRSHSIITPRTPDRPDTFVSIFLLEFERLYAAKYLWVRGSPPPTDVVSS